MTNLDKYQKVFCETLDVEKKELDNLKYQGVESWDSVGHMGLIAALEDEFEIMFETDDIIDLSSFVKGKEILKKYSIDVS